MQGLSKSSNSQMLVFLDNSSDGIDVGHLHNRLRRTTLWFKFCGLSSIYKGLCHRQIVELPNVSFSNASFNNVVVSLGFFFNRTQNLIMEHCFADTSIFSKYFVTHCLVIHECSTLYAHFFLFSHRLLYTSVRMFSCALSAEKIIFSLSPHAQCFQLTSYISPLVRHTAVGMRSLES